MLLPTVSMTLNIMETSFMRGIIFIDAIYASAH